MKRETTAVFLALFLVLALTPLISAKNKIEISTLGKEKFSGSENITLKISLYDSSNNPLNGIISLSISDSEKRTTIEKAAASNSLVEINLGENAPPGYWKIVASYEDEASKEVTESSALFEVEANEQAKFEFNSDTLTIINAGNTPYSRIISVIIGDSVGAKKIENLGVGEKINLRLTAPDGVYNIKITDGQTTLSRESVSLTGEVIGILNKDIEQGTSGITGGVGASRTFRNTVVYAFLIAVFGAAVLIAIERKFRSKLGK